MVKKSLPKEVMPASNVAISRGLHLSVCVCEGGVASSSRFCRFLREMRGGGGTPRGSGLIEVEDGVGAMDNPGRHPCGEVT